MVYAASKSLRGRMIRLHRPARTVAAVTSRVAAISCAIGRYQFLSVSDRWGSELLP